MHWNIIIGLALTLTSCTGYKLGTPVPYRQELSKPIVAMLPIIDRTMTSLSGELTDALRYQLNQNNSLFLVDSHEFQNAIQTKGPSQLFGTNLFWVKDAFEHDEFAVFLELLEHVETPDAKLAMTLRVRVVDLRKKEPQVILQEQISQLHSLNDLFEESPDPIARAHTLLVQETAKHVEEYILLARGV